jgi:GntP family gluconate:H+ symporter
MLIPILLIICIVYIVISTTRLKLHPFLALLTACFLFGIFSGMPAGLILESIETGFGGTIGKIGVVIIAGIIIGIFLEKSNGAFAMANIILKLIGPKRVHAVMALIGYIVSIPVFCDSGFIILSPLNKSLSRQAGLSLAGTAIALSMGLFSTHTMVPPTPGPIAAAGILEADLGLVILIGLPVSLFSLILTTLFAKKITNKAYTETDSQLNNEHTNQKLTNTPTIKNNDQITWKLSDTPPAWKSFLPIVLPIILIVLHSIAEYPANPFGVGKVKNIISFIGNPVVALLAGMLLSFTLPVKFEKKMLAPDGWVGEALKSAAIIILITGAGGAFGKILQNSDIGTILGKMIGGAKLGLWLPFFIAAALKTAQGSSTVAIITAASMIAPLMPALGFDSEFSKAMVVVAIGAGSCVFSHANDSYFWVVTQLSNMNVKQGYKLMSTGSAILGFTAMIILSIINIFV